MRTHVRLAVATCALLTFFYLRSHLGAISERAADLKYPFQASIPFDDLKSVGSSGGGIVDTNVVSTETQIDSGSEKEMEQPNAVVDDWQAKDHDIVKAEEMVPSRNLTSANTTGAVAMEEIIPDKVIVMGKLKEQDTDWVAQELPEYVIISDSTSKSDLKLTLTTQLVHRNLHRERSHRCPLHSHQQRARGKRLPHLHHRALHSPS